MVWRFVTIFLVKVEFNDLCGLFFCLYVLGLLLSSVILGYTGKSTGPKYRNGQAVTMKKTKHDMFTECDHWQQSCRRGNEMSPKAKFGVVEAGRKRECGPLPLTGEFCNKWFLPVDYACV